MAMNGEGIQVAPNSPPNKSSNTLSHSLANKLPNKKPPLVGGGFRDSVGQPSISRAVWPQPIAGAVRATGVASAAARSRGKL